MIKPKQSGHQNNGSNLYLNGDCFKKWRNRAIIGTHNAVLVPTNVFL